MMLHAYSSLYLDKSSRTLGNMLHRFDKEAPPFRGDFVMWLEIILIFPFFVFRKTEMF